MGMVYAEITLVNAVDLGMSERHLIDKDEVKQINVRMLVDSGAYIMAINESIREQLDLSFIEKRKAIMADGSVKEYDVVGPVMAKFANRTATCNAFVLQGNNEPLLGVIPMEEMDVMMHPQRQEQIVNPKHPEYAQLIMKKAGVLLHD